MATCCPQSLIRVYSRLFTAHKTLPQLDHAKRPPPSGRLRSNGVGASDATDHSPDGVCAIHSSPFELPGSLADSVFQPLQSSSCLVLASRKMPPSKALIRIDRYDQGCVS